MEGLSIDDDERLLIPIASKENAANPNLALCFVGRFLTDRCIHVPIMTERTVAVWCPKKGVLDQGSHHGYLPFLILSFAGIQKVIKGGLWSFDKYTFLLSLIRK